jgi:Hint domain-containing protein
LETKAQSVIRGTRIFRAASSFHENAAVLTKYHPFFTNSILKNGLVGAAQVSSLSGRAAAGRRPYMEKNTTFAQTRRNLFAAASIVLAALWARGARAHEHEHGHGHGHGHGDGHNGWGGGHCCLRGTLIRTPSGEQEISTLAIGDLVVTHSGQEKPIKWIGRRNLRRAPGKVWSADVLPIKIVRSALAEGVPHRDLYLSSQHALYFDGLLVTVGSLVNGSTIVRCDADEQENLDYFHLELAEHDIVFAEGAPSETLFSATGEYKLFDNLSERASIDRKTTSPGQPIAPQINVTEARCQLRSRLRSGLARLLDRRNDFDKLRDRL